MKKMQQQLPFQIDPATGCMCAADHELVADVFAKADPVTAEFIKQACNSHYELLEQANYMDSAIGGEPNEDYADDEVIEIRVTGAFIKQLRQAIQNANK
jgi:hypothetical protein